MNKAKTEHVGPSKRTRSKRGRSKRERSQLEISGAAEQAKPERPRSLIFHTRHPVPGSSPGALAHSPDALAPVIQVIDYGPGHHRVREITDVEELAAYREAEHVAWIDIQGIGDPNLFRRLAEIFELDPLAIADAINIPVRPKAEVFESSQQVIMRMSRLDDQGGVTFEQVTFFIGRHYVLTIQERPGDVFDPVRKRIEVGGRMHRHGADYLAFALIDALIDGCFPLLETLAQQLEDLERKMLEHAREELLPRLYRLRRDLVALRRTSWPQREAIATLVRDDSPFISDEVRRYLAECHDHAVQIAEVADGHRDIASSLAELYMSLASKRANEVMQVLTVMASIFIPLTFIAGVYGMNFEYMPELHQRWAYPATMAVMFVIGFSMLFYFWRRGWFGKRRRDRHDD